MALPDVVIQYTDGNLGAQAPNVDGISAIILSTTTAPVGLSLGDFIGPVKSLADVEALGINNAYDTTNTCLCWQHMKEFFAAGATGKDLYFMLVPKTVTMAQMCDVANNYVTKLSQLQGVVKLLAITRVPDGAYTPTFQGQLEQDLIDATVKLKAFITAEQNAHRPLQVLIEGRNFQGTINSIENLRSTIGVDRLSVVIGNDYNVSSTIGQAVKYASVGYVLGALAVLPVQRNIGRVLNGAIAFTKVGLSNGTELKNYTTTDLTTLNDRGFIFFKPHIRKSGFYINNDHTCTAVTSDYKSIGHGRVMDKVYRIAYDVYLNDLLDDFQLEASGKMAVSTVKHFQGVVEKEINAQMANEISAVSAFVDPTQNVLSTGKVTIAIAITPRFIAEQIVAKIGFNNPLNSL